MESPKVVSLLVPWLCRQEYRDGWPNRTVCCHPGLRQLRTIRRGSNRIHSSILHRDLPPLIKVLEIHSRADLALFSRYLTTQGVRHRLTEEGLNQVLWAESEAGATFARLAFEKYQAGELQIEDVDEAGSFLAGLSAALRRYPLTLALITLNVLLFPVGMGSGQLDSDSLFARLMLLEIRQIGDDYYFVPLDQTLAHGDWWRLLTPMFIHFSWLHIVFNLLWVWEIGRRIEAINGAFTLFWLALFASAAANVLQYLMIGPALFGGMSGVVFGLLGFSLVWSRLVPERSMGVARGIYIFMLVYLAVGFTGVIDLLGLGNLANGAHLGGLLAGLVTAGSAVLLYRRQRPVR